MQLNSVKSAADLPFKGIELVKTDATITGVIVGGKLHIKTDGYGSLKVLVEAPGERVKRHRVAATLEGFGDKTEYFENSWDADTAAGKLETLGAKVERSEVQVVIDAFGVVVEADAAPATTAATFDAEVPF